MKTKEMLLKTRDVAWILDCSPDDVNALARSEKLKAFKQGRNWRFLEADVVAYKKRMEKQRRKAARAEE